MAKTPGSFAIPAPSNVSQLVNDARYMSVQEYVLNSESLYGNSQITITDLPTGAIINNIELRVTDAFAPTATQHNIAVNGANNEILMDSSWNDPNTVGNYATDAYYTVTASGIKVIHDLTAMTAGSAILRIYIYEVND